LAYGIPRALPSLLAWKQVHHHTVSRQHLCTWLSGREIAACKPEMGVSDWYANWCWYLIWRRAACEWTATWSVTENKIEMIGADSSSLGSRPLMRESRRSPKAKSPTPAIDCMWRGDVSVFERQAHQEAGPEREAGCQNRDIRLAGALKCWGHRRYEGVQTQLNVFAECFLSLIMLRLTASFKVAITASSLTALRHGGKTDFNFHRAADWFFYTNANYSDKLWPQLVFHQTCLVFSCVFCACWHTLCSWFISATPELGH